MLGILKRREQQAANKTEGTAKKTRATAAQLRAQRDISELSLPSTISLTFPDPDDILHFEATITPDDGYYKGGVFRFNVNVGPQYPHEPPKVKCTQKIYHPNIDLEGNVCLNILREDWKPVLSLHSVFIGLQLLFLEPNPGDPLNKEAAEDLRNHPSAFAKNVKNSMMGGYVKSVSFDNVLKN
ncbi:putative NEDD8 conjugating enzyme [Ascodesmis nigricans]|uniref:NEDD8-conjugating enzyme UBC12 n=1 Tax=Ascodesmis nigricans TaxID=341454 RepID=A0A4S2N699_9PEZI|nr:putative NEDD8 conjugating enzyme [Ascodesmis nigricans]